MKKRLKVVIKNIPEKEPGELPATTKQKDYLKHLGNFDDGYLNTLGKWQASFLIDRVSELKEGAESKYSNKRHSCFGSFAVLCGIAVILMIILAVIGAVFKSSGETQVKETSNNKLTALKDQKTINLSNQKIEEKPKPPISDFKVLTYPVEIVTTDKLEMTNSSNEKVVIPENTIVLIEKRSESGFLSMRIDGKYHGAFDDVLINKVKLSK